MAKRNWKLRRKILSPKHYLGLKYAAVVILGLTKSGIWVFPAIGASFLISRDPFTQPFSDPASHYLVTSWLGSFVAHILGITAFEDFIIFHLLFALLVPIILFLAIKSSVGANTDHKILLLGALIPAMYSSFYWVGMDSLTLLLMSLSMLYFKSWKVQIFIGTLLGLQHFEISTVASGSLLLFYLICGRGFRQRFEIFSSASLFSGVLFGKLFQNVIFSLSGVEVLQTRFDLGISSFRNLSESLLVNGWQVLWSGFGPLWIVVFLAIRNWNRQSLAFIVAALIVFSSLLFVQDHSRILQLSLFLITFRGLVASPRIATHLNYRFLGVMLALWICVPWMWVWQETRFWVTPYTVKFVLAQFFGIGSLPDLQSITMWPFS